MHSVSTFSDSIKTPQTIYDEEHMINKKDMLLLESILFLRAVKQCGKKCHAAELLGTSVDTINKYIENLEDYFGVKLISTNGRGSMLTEVGKCIVEKSDKFKEALDDIYNIRLANSEIKGEVKVFMPLGYASYLVPQDLSSLFNTYPELSINSVSSMDINTANPHEVDIIITDKAIDTHESVLITERQVHCGFFASSHYLAQNGYPVDLDDLATKHRFLIKQDGLLNRVFSAEQLKKAEICFITNNTLSLINAINNGTGVGILPLSFALQGLVCLDNITCDCPISYYLYANRHTKDLPRVRTLINFYKEIMDKLENPVPVPALKDELLDIVRFRDAN